MYSGTQYSGTGCSYSVMLIPFNHHVMLIPFGFLYKFVVPPTRILVVVPIVVLFLRTISTKVPSKPSPETRIVVYTCIQYSVSGICAAVMRVSCNIAGPSQLLRLR